MPFGLENIRGLEGLPNLNLMNLLKMGGQFLGGALIFIFIAVSVYGFFKWKNRVKEVNKIYWFEEVNGQMVPIDKVDDAQELTLPNSNIKVFFIKKRKMYLPRPVKKMGPRHYWFCIRNNREIVNFTMKNLNVEMSEAGLDFDHTDMRYALTYLKDLIQRNYRDKATPWWKEYKDIIAVVILVFVLTVAMFFIMSKLGSLADKIGVLIDHADTLVKSAEATRGTGIIKG
jgi:hypothetical protein